MMMKNYVRVCPVCDTENPPERAHCRHCASLLADVDFSLPREAATESPEMTEATEATTEATTEAITEAITDAPAASAAPSPTATSAETDAKATLAHVPALAIKPAAPQADALRCPDPDCGQLNPPGTPRCLYCNTPLASVAAVEVIAAPLPFAPSSDLELAPPDLAANIALPDFVMTADRARQHADTMPPALAARFRVKRELVAASNDADLLIVEALESGETRVIKIYRRGVPPDNRLLERLKVTAPHVVRIFEHGHEAGVDWEVMEFCRAGSLRALMKGRPLEADLLLALVREMAAGLNEIHAFNILHRDLKPENVLLRRHAPLSLALTDFGLASLTEGDRHFTDNACTLKYAAPEALTGVLDAKTDWWSLGMILLEAASGRHPFDGLSEQVIHHYLATRPIAIEGVQDPNFAQLCRGLLLRDPEQRYGAEEVARWLAGDPGLPPLLESDGKIVRPYQIGKHSARSREELARALVENWQAGARDLERGLVREWLKTDLRDFELLRSLDDIMMARGENIECRLLRFLRVAAPGLPPVWRSELADYNALMTHARQAIADGAPPADMQVWQDWLESLYAARALSFLDDAELAALDQRWRQCFLLIERVWEAARGKNRQLRSSLTDAQGGAVNFDAAVYGWDAAFRFPPRREWHAPILLALSMPNFLTMVRRDVSRAAGRYADEAPWFAAVAKQAQNNTWTREEQEACLLVAWRLRAVAWQEAEAKRSRRQAEASRWRRAIESGRQTFESLLARFQVADALVDSDTQAKWRLLLGELQTLSAQLTQASYPGADFDRLQNSVSTLRRQSFALEAAFDQAKACQKQVAIIMTAPRLVLLCVPLLIVGLLFGVGWALCLAAIGAGAIALLAWRWRQAKKDVIAQMRRLKRQSRALAEQVKKDARAV
jgi:serine/threonine protein kinase